MAAKKKVKKVQKRKAQKKVLKHGNKFRLEYGAKLKTALKKFSSDELAKCLDAELKGPVRSSMFNRILARLKESTARDLETWAQQKLYRATKRKAA